MKLSKTEKTDIFQKFGFEKSARDSGSSESQIALFTHRIAYLTKYLSSHKKDKSATMGLTRLVGKRRGLLNYLKGKSPERYRAILSHLGLRK